MPLKTDAVGKTYPPVLYAVGREKVKEYALATGETQPLHLEAGDRRRARLRQAKAGTDGLVGAEEGVGGAEHCHEARRNGCYERDGRCFPGAPALRQGEAFCRLFQPGFPQPGRQFLHLLRPRCAGRAKEKVGLEAVLLEHGQLTVYLSGKGLARASTIDGRERHLTFSSNVLTGGSGES